MASRMLIVGVAGNGGGSAINLCLDGVEVLDDVDVVLTRGVEGVSVDVGRIVECVRIRCILGLGADSFACVAVDMDASFDVDTLVFVLDCGVRDIGRIVERAHC